MQNRKWLVPVNSVIQIMSLISEIVHNYNRVNFQVVTSLPEFMTDSVYLINHSEVQKKMVEAFKSKELAIRR